MTRSRFYKVEPEQYLLPAVSRREGEQEQIEEPVRQWAAYELIRCYGVLPDSIEFEHPVKVGSKRYRIDILILRGGHPFVVVECKHREFSKHEQGMEQAISYADAQEIGAEFAVYTNGDIWHVKRRVQDRWITVADLPRMIDREGTIPINQLLSSLAYICPLLSKIDEPAAGDNARQFLNALQSLCNGHKYAIGDSDQHLLNATDNLLRVLTVLNDPKYQYGKLQTAQHALERYRKTAGFALEFLPAHTGLPLSASFREMCGPISFMVDSTADLAAPDVLLLRVISAIIHYATDIETFGKGYPALPGALRDAVRKYVEYGLAVYLNVSLPDPIDHGEIRDMKLYCQTIGDSGAE